MLQYVANHGFVLLMFGMAVFFGGKRWLGDWSYKRRLTQHPALQAAVECWAREMVKTVPAGDLTYELDATTGDFVCVDAVVRPTDKQLALFCKALLSELSNCASPNGRMILQWGTPQLQNALKAAGLENMPAPTLATMFIEQHEIRFGKGSIVRGFGKDVVWTADGGHCERADDVEHHHAREASATPALAAPVRLITA